MEYNITIDVSSPQFQWMIDGGWARNTTDGGDSLNTVWTSMRPNSRFRFPFNGTAIYFYGQRGPDYGGFVANVDGAHEQSPSTRSEGGVVHQQMLYSATGLSRTGGHVMDVAVSGDGQVVADYVVITQYADQPIHTTIIDHTDPSIEYTGGDWYTVDRLDQGYRTSALRLGNGSSSQMTLSFVGSSIQVFGVNSGDGGNIKTIIDGEVPVRIPTRIFWNAVIPQTPYYTITGLSDGPHVLRMQNLWFAGRSDMFFDYAVVNSTIAPQGASISSQSSQAPPSLTSGASPSTTLSASSTPASSTPSSPSPRNSASSPVFSPPSLPSSDPPSFHFPDPVAPQGAGAGSSSTTIGVGAIAGICVGAAAVIIGIILAFILCCYRKKMTARSQSHGSDHHSQDFDHEPKYPIGTPASPRPSPRLNPLTRQRSHVDSNPAYGGALAYADSTPSRHVDSRYLSDHTDASGLRGASTVSGSQRLGDGRSRSDRSQDEPISADSAYSHNTRPWERPGTSHDGRLDSRVPHSTGSTAPSSAALPYMRGRSDASAESAALPSPLRPPRPARPSQYLAPAPPTSRTRELRPSDSISTRDDDETEYPHGPDTGRPLPSRAQNFQSGFADHKLPVLFEGTNRRGIESVYGALRALNTQTRPEDDPYSRSPLSSGTESPDAPRPHPLSALDAARKRGLALLHDQAHVDQPSAVRSSGFTVPVTAPPDYLTATTSDSDDADRRHMGRVV